MNHRLFFQSTETAEPTLLDAAEVLVDFTGPIHFASPVFGVGWLAAEGAVNIKEYSHHRLGVITMEWKFRISQRYAIDWVKFGPDGMLFKSNPLINENWYC